MVHTEARQGVVVTAAGTGINLALGVLYTWSIFQVAIRESIEAGGEGAFAWEIASLNDPYAVCLLVFACGMILAGRMQDAYGPRRTALTGGVLVGLGFLLISQSTSYFVWLVGFGLLVGLGIAFGYSAATPAAMKWFPPQKTGLIAGIVVSGFGLASVYIAPLSQYLLGRWGLSGTMLFLAVAFLLVVGILSRFLVNPPPGYRPAGLVVANPGAGATPAPQADHHPEKDMRPMEMLGTAEFWLVWFLYFIGAGAGLMVIGSLAGMAKSSLGEAAFVAVAILAVGNAAGRIVAGGLADRVGRGPTLVGIFSMQALLMFAAIPIVGAVRPNVALLIGLATLIGFNYGANLALFPLFAKQLWGLKHFGANYGTLFTAWGFGGFIMSKLSQELNASTGSFTTSFITAGILLAVGVVFIVFMRDSRHS